MTCFEVSQTGSLIAIGLASGEGYVLQQSCIGQYGDEYAGEEDVLHFERVNEHSEALPLPGEADGGASGREGEVALREEEAFSSSMGSDLFWRRTMAFLDQETMAKGRAVESGGTFAINEKRIPANMIRITAPSGSSGRASRRSSSVALTEQLLGMASLNGDVSMPYWNQIVRILYHSQEVTSLVMAHVNCFSPRCAVDQCVICELALLFPSLGLASGMAPVHTEHLIKALRRHPLFESVELRAAASFSWERPLHFLKFIMDVLGEDEACKTLRHNELLSTAGRCQACDAVVYRHGQILKVVTVATASHGSHAETLVGALEALLAKSREPEGLRCTTCSADSSIFPDSSTIDLPFVIFALDPAMYQRHYRIAEQITLPSSSQKFDLRVCGCVFFPPIRS